MQMGCQRALPDGARDEAAAKASTDKYAVDLTANFGHPLWQELHKKVGVSTSSVD